jgi:hypothetical protein
MGVFGRLFVGERELGVRGHDEELVTLIGEVTK